MENKINKKVGIVIVVVVVLGVLFATIFLGKQPADVAVAPQEAVLPAPQTSTPVSTPKNPQTTPIDTPKKSVSVYKDGTYSATGSYMSPGGPDQVKVTVALTNDIITSILFTPEPGDNNSAKYQNIFATNYKQYVIGKNIADVYLTKVSGSSLTSKGFNDALAQIKSQAQA